MNAPDLSIAHSRAIVTGDDSPAYMPLSRSPDYPQSAGFYRLHYVDIGDKRVTAYANGVRGMICIDDDAELRLTASQCRYIAELADALAKELDKAADWREWAGAEEPPVFPWQTVSVKLRDGRQMSGNAREFSWRCSGEPDEGCGADVVAYAIEERP